MTYKNVICPVCKHLFNISSNTLRSKKTETLCDGIYREHFNLQCPECNSQVIFSTQYEIAYATSKSLKAEGTVAYGVYPDMDGTLDPDLWKELPQEVC